MTAPPDRRPRPHVPPFSGLPKLLAIDALRGRNQWVAWDYVWRSEKGKWDKPPVDPHTGYGASHSKPSTWSSYDRAVAIASRRGLAGVGFVLTADDNLTGIDLDRCRDPATGRLDPMAADVVALAETYCEVSPSGRGLRLFVLGKVEKTTKCDKAGIEIYREQRYLTCTGDHVAGTPDDIRAAPRTLALLMGHVTAATVAAAANTQQEHVPMPLKRETAGQQGSATSTAAVSFWASVNAAAFARLQAWVPELFGADARHQPGTGGYRVTSKALGRNLEEDLSITRDGCVDFGVADQGDARQGRRSAIDLVVQFGRAADTSDAAHWLCQRLDLEPEALGWRSLVAKSVPHASTSQWPEPKPLPSGLLPVDAFDPAMVPAAIGPWVMDIAERMQCPPDFVAASAMTALSAVIGRKVAIRPQTRTDWTEVPNLWGCLVGRPGAMKSPSMAEALKPLNRLEGQAREDNDAKLKQHLRDLEAHKIKHEAAQKSARAAAGRGEPIGRLLDLDAPEKPPAKRYVCNDATYEALGEILAANPNGVLAFRDELVSLLRTLDREENAAARGFFLTAWNGTSGYTFDRIIRGYTHIDAACVSLLGSTQPGRLADYLGRAVKGGGGDDGLIQRFSLLVWPDDGGAWREVDRYPDSGARQAAWDAFTRLDALTASSVGAEQSDFDKLPFLRLDDAAADLFRSWRADLEKKLRCGSLHVALESHLAKYRKLVPSLALINHLADGGGGRVTDISVLRALSFAQYLESHARRAYGSGLNSEVGTAKAILERVRKGHIAGEFTARDIQRREWSNLTDKEQIGAGLDLLDDLGWVRSRRIETGGRPKIVFQASPRVA